MADINNQTPTDEMISNMSVKDLEALKLSWIREREKLYQLVDKCDEIIMKVHYSLQGKGNIDQHIDETQNVTVTDLDIKTGDGN